MVSPELPAAEPGDHSSVEKMRDLSSCGLLYPDLMKQSQPLTRSAIIEQGDRQEEANEVVETFQGEQADISSSQLLSCCCRRLGVPAGRQFDQ